MKPLFDRSFAAILFDMDGTLIDSIAVAERVWGGWARRHGLDVATFLPTIHGRRVTETIRTTGLDVDIAREAAAITTAELEDVAGIVPIPGAAEFLASIPADQQALVTSAPRALALRRLAAANVLAPKLIIAGEDVTHGKPAPDPYLLAAAGLGVSARDCLVVEDIAAGITSAEAAGASVLVITATHHTELTTPHPRCVDYSVLRVVSESNGFLRVFTR